MKKCNCGQPRGIGIHQPECDTLNNLTFEDFKGVLFFRDFPEDMLRYATGFHHMIDERPEFYAAAMHSELLYNLQEVFAPEHPQRTIDAMVEVHENWFSHHFNDERLTSLRKSRIIAQELGFSISHKIGFKVSSEHFFGIYGND